ncbi:amphi-Trp domain-containing protein [Desulfovibrio sp. Huiquan2017]|uniref:amphi-Trp domain-containing protein n=1 Tax=Desulfovibrio sp. Huiquan2017 TaxID=2816861 RepID=UPI001A933A75
MEKQKISVKKVLEYQDAVSYIEDLAKSFKSGTIVVESGEERVVMKPSAQVSIKVEAKAKSDKQKIAFELSWTEAAGAELKIGDAEATPAPAIRPEGGAPALKPEAEPPATKTPAMAPAKSEEAKPPARTEAKSEAGKPAPKKHVPKGATKKSTPKKRPAKPAGNE